MTTPHEPRIADPGFPFDVAIDDGQESGRPEAGLVLPAPPRDPDYERCALQRIPGGVRLIRAPADTLDLPLADPLADALTALGTAIIVETANGRTVRQYEAAVRR